MNPHDIVSCPPSFASFVGVDLHKYTITPRAVDPAGKPIASLTCDTTPLRSAY